MAKPDFSALLSMPADEVKRPVQLPEGTYYGTITGYELVESGKKRTPGVQIAGVLSHAHEDVDLTGPDGQTIEVAGKNFPQQGNTFWLSENSTFMFIDFIKSLGIETAGQNLGDLVPQITGQTIQLDIGQEPAQDRNGNAVEDEEGNVRMRTIIRRMSGVKD